MAYTIEQIENAIIDALEPLRSTRNVLAIKTYQGELEADDLKKITGRIPAVFVVYGGSSYTPHGGRKIEKARFFVFVADRSLRSEDESRRGSATNPGTYTLLNDVRDLLTGQQLDLEIYPLELIGEEPIWFSGGLSVYSAEYETGQGHLYPAA